MRNLLPGIPYVWFPTPSGWRTEILYEALLDAGVAVASAGQFAADPSRPRRGVRIAAGGALTLDEYEDALQRITATCAHPGRYRRKPDPLPVAGDHSPAEESALTR